MNIAQFTEKDTLLWELWDNYPTQYTEGWNANEVGKIAHNPYPVGSMEEQAWNLGWNDRKDTRDFDNEEES